MQQQCDCCNCCGSMRSKPKPSSPTQTTRRLVRTTRRRMTAIKTRRIIVGISTISILCFFLFVQSRICWTSTCSTTIIATSSGQLDDVGSSTNNRPALFGGPLAANAVNTTNYVHESPITETDPLPPSTTSTASESKVKVKHNAKTRAKAKTKPKNKNKGKPNFNEEFTWDDVLYSFDGDDDEDDIFEPRCGLEKCFFYSKSDPNGNGTGYVISTDNRRKGIYRGWTYAKRIDQMMKEQRKFEENQETTTTTTTTESSSPQQRNRNIQTRHHFYRNKPIIKSDFPNKIREIMGQSRMKSSKNVMIQRVNVAPINDLEVIGCSDPRIIRAWHHVTDRLLLLQPSRGDWDFVPQWYLTEAIIKSINTFDYSINNTLRVLEELPRLVYDFQIFVNKRGEIFHFDLDRGLRKPKENSSSLRQCKCNLQSLSKLLKHLIDVMTSSSSSPTMDDGSSNTLTSQSSSNNITEEASTTNTRHQLQYGGYNRTVQLVQGL